MPFYRGKRVSEPQTARDIPRLFPELAAQFAAEVKAEALSRRAALRDEQKRVDEDAELAKFYVNWRA